MGTKLAPNYGNLFMSDFETKHIFTYSLQPIYYRKFIDDIFLIWDHPPAVLDNFIDHLNSVHPTINSNLPNQSLTLPSPIWIWTSTKKATLSILYIEHILKPPTHFHIYMDILIILQQLLKGSPKVKTVEY